MEGRILSLSVACVLAAIVQAGAQSPESQPGLLSAAPGPARPSFRSGTELVALSVTVLDAKQKYVAGLQAGDFVILDDGVPHTVTFFAAEQSPLDLVLLIDSSASMLDKMPLVRKAASGFLHALRSGDRASLIEFRDSVSVRQPFTTDLGVLDGALAQLTPRGGTALYNAVYIALKELGRLDRPAEGARRRAIVLLSDGDDTASLIGFDDVQDLARRSDVSIYAIGLKSATELLREKAETGRQFQTSSDTAMRSLAKETGGRAFFAVSPAGLTGVYGEIAEELTRQYALAYTPTNTAPDGTFRRINVQIATHPGLRSRTRAGYYADSRRPQRLHQVVAGNP